MSEYNSDKPSTFGTVKTFLSRLVTSYADFFVPAAIFIVFNSCIDQHTRDPEKLAVLWLKFNQSSEATRAAVFPAMQPGSAHHHDDDAMGANMDDAI